MLLVSDVNKDACKGVVAYLLIGALSGALGQVDIGLLQHDVGVAPADTLDGGHGRDDLALTIDVGTHDTQDMLELLWDDQRLRKNK